ncbi:prolyl oligopeptidase family serine peptidase [Paenibacillus sp. 2TAB19]|uniref:prolyl oligopeptidase family serine peptidase n=1 Tax=Paenibacillus sp. 2TAB19 TaxID=3233003 RepID=UPI003F9739C6
MRRGLVYVLPIFIIVVVMGLLINRQGSKEMPIKAALSSEQSEARYLATNYDVNVHNDIVYASKVNESETEEPLKLDVYEPTNDNNNRRPVFIFIHGGGYKEGSKSDAATISNELAKRGYVVVSMDYRLKKDPFVHFQRTLSDAYEDISDVIGWISHNAEAYRMDAEQLAIGGDSAGGYLSMNVVNEYLKRDPSIVHSIFAIVDIYGGKLENSVDEQLPPILMIHGTIDQLIPYQQSVDLKDTLERQGIYHDLFTMEGVGHDYKNEKYIDEVIETTLHFLWNVMRNSESRWLPASTGIEAVSGDSFDIKLPDLSIGHSAERQISVALPEGWSLDNADSDESLQVRIPAGLNRGNRSIFITLDQNREAVQSFAINVNVVDPLEESFETYFDATDHKIKTRMQITNRSKNKFSGTIQVDYETEQSSQGKFTTNVDQVEPGDRVSFHIPELARGKRVIHAYNQAGALLQKKEDLFNALVLQKSEKPIHIDGNLEEWKGQTPFDVNKIMIADWKGIEDLSAIGYMTWDVDHVYLALDVTDDTHTQEAEGLGIWSGDSLQLAIGLANDDGSLPLEYHELGIAMTGKGQLSKWRWIAPRGFRADDSIKLDYAIVRNNQHTIYEMAIPMSELTQDIAMIKPGLKMKLSLLVNDNDGAGRRGWLEYNSGIGTAKDINAFGDVFLAGD